MNGHFDATRLGPAALLAAILLACAPAHAQQVTSDPSADAKPSDSAKADDGVKPEAKRLDHDSVKQADETDIAKESENPIGNLTVLPLQNYTNFGVGPNKGTQNILEFEPVVPFHVNPDWNIIARAVIPVVWNPDLSPFPSVPQAFAPTDFETFLTPSRSTDGWLWGVGPIAQLPTATSPTVGSSVWGLGPTAVLVHTGDKTVAGLLVNNVWSLGGVEQGPGAKRYESMLLEPFGNYNFGGGWFVSTSPLITADWDTPGRKWTVPLGGSAGRIIKLGGKLPVKFSLGGYYNVVTPQHGARWTTESIVAVIF
jgi:hypothetical protein